MYVAVSTESFLPAEGPSPSLAELCEGAAETGFDKLELHLDEAEGPLKPSEIAAAPERFAATFRETTRLTPVGFCLADDVPPSVTAGLAKAAKHLKVAQLTVPASPLGTPFNDEVDRLKAHHAAASPEAVRVSVRVRSGELTEDPDTAVQLCKAVKGLGITYDPSYFVGGPYADVDREAVYGHVFHVHLRDTSKERLQVKTGLGEIDYAKLIARLEKEGYRGALSVDLLPENVPADERALELRKLRMLLETLL
ncbi:sugar phosphate isomerase/epimerase family protein [Alienimonas sp. DA493]|uniref:sugar phosphate isomerase/epimerase family protein n=1 Tax=Alienimonas sp. DA493 TaxID=3373605 RepID=UPI003754F529